MRWRPLTWLLLSIMFFVAAVFFWRLGDQWAADKKARLKQSELSSANKETERKRGQGTRGGEQGRGAGSVAVPGGNLNAPLPQLSPHVKGSNAPTSSPLANRLSNTTRPLKELV